jgi:hypothetical protein
MKASPVIAQVESSGTLAIFSVPSTSTWSPPEGVKRTKPPGAVEKWSDRIGKFWREEKGVVIEIVSGRGLTVHKVELIGLNKIQSPGALDDPNRQSKTV